MVRLFGCLLMLISFTSIAGAQEGCSNPFGLAGGAAGSKYAGNYVKAFQLYSQLEQCGDVVGSIGVGELYENGLGVDQNYKIALEKYTVAARAGHSLAFLNLARMYASGKGTLQDYVKGHALANLASIYGGGDVPSSASKLLVSISERMSPAQISEAQNLAKKCKSEYDKTFAIKTCGLI